MIVELILTAIVGGIVGFLIVYFKKRYNDNKILKDIPEKLEQQDVRFFANGKKLSIYDKEIKPTYEKEIKEALETKVKPTPKKIVKKKTKKKPISQKKKK